MSLTTQQLEELLRLALQENERLRLESQRIRSSVAEDTEHLRKRLARAEEDLGKTINRLYMDPDERKALARDVSDASIRLLQAVDLLRRRNRVLAGDAHRDGLRLRGWAEKLRWSP